MEIEGKTSSLEERTPSLEGQTSSLEEKQQLLTNEEVISHTVDLWKYHEVPVDMPEPHLEYDQCHLKNKGNEIVAARVRGKRHKHDGTNCDDYFKVVEVEGIQVIVVSDGAGSKPYSRIGAKISCEECVSYLQEEIREFKKGSLYKQASLEMSNDKFTEVCSFLANMVQQSVIHGGKQVEEGFNQRKDKKEFQEAIGRELELSDFSGTLLVVVVVPVEKRKLGEERDYLIVSCQIGDGAIALINDKAEFNKALTILNAKDSGSFAGETEFLTSPGMQEVESLMHRTVITKKKMSHLMVMTDGVAEDYYPNAPELMRLYLDLYANGILNFSNKGKATIDDKLALKLPKPIEYRWVNDTSIKVGIQYVNQILKSMDYSLEQLWEHKYLLCKAERGSFVHPKDKASNLKIWLDNYVERGSFDDRTLVILNV